MDTNTTILKYKYGDNIKDFIISEDIELGELETKILGKCNLLSYEVEYLVIVYKDTNKSIIGGEEFSFFSKLNEINEFTNIDYVEVIPRFRNEEGKFVDNPYLNKYLEYMRIKDDERIARSMQDGDSEFPNILQQNAPNLAFLNMLGTFLNQNPSNIQDLFENNEQNEEENEVENEEQTNINNGTSSNVVPNSQNLDTNTIPTMGYNTISFDSNNGEIRIDRYIFTPIQNSGEIDSEEQQINSQPVWNSIDNIMQTENQTDNEGQTILTSTDGLNWHPTNRQLSNSSLNSSPNSNPNPNPNPFNFFQSTNPFAILNQIMRNNFSDVKIVSTKDEISAMNVKKYGDIKNENFTKSRQCNICLEDYQDDEEILLLKCNHYYHKDCITNWISKESNKCPICKEKVSEGKATNL